MTGRCRKAEESPDSTGRRIRLSRTEGAGRSRAMESATENRQPARVMVKGRCKRPPARLKRRAQGKPSSEQDQIGNRRAARPAASCNGCLRFRVDCSDE